MSTPWSDSNSSDQGPPEQGTPNTARRIARSSSFRVIDKNNKGKVTKKQFLKVVGSLGPETKNRKYWSRKFSEMDVNGKGEITMQEFVRGNLHDKAASDQDEEPEVFVPTTAAEAVEGAPKGRSVRSLVRQIAGNRRVLMLWAFHALVTLLVFQHFMIKKFREKEQGVPVIANRYWWKRMVPPLEFGAMHTVMLQMGILPLTMSHTVLRFLSSTPLRRIIPFQHMTMFHIYLGYVVGAILVVSFIVFLIFFGILCTDFKRGLEPKNFCNNFRMEIMRTGYAMLGMYLLVAIPAYFRNRIAYEVFYYLHQLILIFYALSIAHTMDDKQRSGANDRSQVFKWVTGSLILYLTDRIYRWFNRSPNLRLVSARAFPTPKSVKLVVRKPDGFTFRPGQYVELQIPEISPFYHYYSIGSAPDSSFLEFYILVCDRGSWTHRLWTIIKEEGERPNITVNMLGPYGACVQTWETYDHVVCVSASTGIVPFLSMFQMVSSTLCSVDANWKVHSEREYIDAFDRATSKKRSADAIVADAASVYSKKRELKNDLGFTGLMGWPIVLGALMWLETLAVGLTISWNTLKNLRGLEETVQSEMLLALRYLSLTLVCFYGCVCASYIYKDRAKAFRKFRTFVDIVMLLTFLTAEFLTWDDCFSMLVSQLALKIFLCIYRAVGYGFWLYELSPTMSSSHSGNSTLSSFHLCWVVHEVESISWLKELLNSCLEEAHNKFGDNARHFLQLSVFVTDEKITQATVDNLTSSAPFLRDRIFLGRPNIGKGLGKLMTARKLQGSIRPTGVMYCGGYQFGNEVATAVMQINEEALAYGHGQHMFGFTKEFYGQRGRSRTRFEKVSQGTASAAGNQWAVCVYVDPDPEEDDDEGSPNWRSHLNLD